MHALDTIISNVWEQLERKVDLSGTEVSYHDLTENAPDDLIKNVFEAKYQHHFDGEYTRITSDDENPVIDFQNRAVQKKLEQLMTALKQAFTIPTEQIKPILKSSLQTSIEYLIEPLNTSKRTIFDESASLPSSFVIRKLREFGKYKYYADALEKYIQAAHMDTLSRDQFETLVDEINASLFGIDNIENSLKLCAFVMKELNDLQGRTDKAIDIQVLIKAFKDRRLTDFTTALNIEKEIGREEINLYGLRQVLQRFVLLKKKEPHAISEKFNAKEDTTETRLMKARSNEELLETLESEPTLEETAEIIDIDLYLEQENIHQPGHQVPEDRPDFLVPQSQQTVPSSLSEATGDFIKEELVDSFVDDTAAIKLSELKQTVESQPLESLMTPKDKKMVLTKIFGNNADDFLVFVRDIDDAPTWQDSMEVLDGTLRKNQMDPYCKEAVALSDIIYSKFYPPEEQ